MQNTGNHDESMDRLLRQTLSEPNVAVAPGRCVDAETIAAWSDGALSPADATLVETHLSECSQCQALFAAFARSAPPSQASDSPWQRWRLQWLVPITAAATAVALWVAIPVNERPGALPQSDARLAAPAEPSPVAAPAPGAAAESSGVVPPAEAPATESPAPPPATLPESAVRDSEQFSPSLSQEPAASLGALREEAPRRQSPDAPNQATESVERLEEAPAPRLGGAREQEAVAPENQAAKAASPPAQVAAVDAVESDADTAAGAPAELRGFALQSRGNTGLDIVSPDPANRWRIVGSARVDRSTDGGDTWEAAVVAPPAALTAGSAPGPLICWLVGPAGAVWLTTDGVQFRQVPFPEAADLRGVQATSASSATVTAVDGRRFRTDDQGQTWTPVAP